MSFPFFFFFGQGCTSCSVTVLNCIFHIRDFFFCCFAAVTIIQFQHSVNSRSRQSLSCVLLRFLAYWAPAIVSFFNTTQLVLSFDSRNLILEESSPLISFCTIKRKMCWNGEKKSVGEKSCRCCRETRFPGYRVISFIMPLRISHWM